MSSLLTQSKSIWALRISLATIFLWFGFLKAFGVSPVGGVILGSFPIILEYPFLYYSLACLEILIGLGILLPRYTTPAAYAGIVHLIVVTFGVLQSSQAFDSWFPLLTLNGEFVVKNLVLIAGFFVILSDYATRSART